MTEPGAVELVHLTDDDGQHCVVRVRGRFRSGVLTGHDVLLAELVAHAGFVDARLELTLLPADLDAWQRALTDLVPGADAELGGDRGPGLSLHAHDDGVLAVTVHDPDCLTATLWMRPPAGWLEEHRTRLERVRRAWPREVVETSPGAYAWRRARQG